MQEGLVPGPHTLWVTRPFAELTPPLLLEMEPRRWARQGLPINRGRLNEVAVHREFQVGDHGWCLQGFHSGLENCWPLRRATAHRTPWESSSIRWQRASFLVLVLDCALPAPHCAPSQPQLSCDPRLAELLWQESPHHGGCDLTSCQQLPGCCTSVLTQGSP